MSIQATAVQARRDSAEDFKHGAAQPWTGFSFPRIALRFHDRMVIAYVLHVLRGKARTMKGLPEIAARIEANELNVYGEIKRRLEALEA